MHSATFDHRILLEPIATENPSGQDIRLDVAPLSLYRQLKQARTMARTVERQLVQGTELNSRADWKSVYQFSIEILSKQAKDLEVAAWLIEALLRLHGFAGLKEGFKFTRQLIEKFWDSLHPLPDEEGLITRVAALSGLNGEEIEGSLIAPIALTPLIQTHSGSSFALWHFQQTKDKTLVENLQTALQHINVESIYQQVEILQETIAEFQELMKVLMDKCQDQTPPSTRILEQLQACLNYLQKQAPQKETASAISDIEAIPESNNMNIPFNIKLCSREQVLQNLIDAAQYFRTTEPHSPLPYILERAVRWGKMPLPELLKELLQDEQVRKQLTHLTGIEFK